MSIISGSVYGGLAPVVIIPTIPAILEIVGLIRITGPRLIPYPVQYFVDIEKYYYHVLIDGWFGTGTMVMAVVAIDSMFVVYVQHACALFKIIGYIF